MESIKTNSLSLAIIPKTIDEATALAERLCKSSLLPKAMQGKMPDVLVTILAGQEMGLSPMASLRNFHVIEGKPVLSADGMIALVLGSGKADYFKRVEETDAAVTYETLRIGADKPRRCTWTIVQAKAAALDKKDNWRLYPRAMLAARAKSELARDVYPDVLAGCYTEDEVNDWVRPPVDAIDAEFTEVPAPSPSVLADAIDKAATTDELKSIGENLKLLPEDQKAEARKRYQARWDQLTKPQEASA